MRLRLARVSCGAWFAPGRLRGSNDRDAAELVTAADKLFLPFDDDPVLSLVLSKAFLLARDSAITDTTITRQVESG